MLRETTRRLHRYTFERLIAAKANHLFVVQSVGAGPFLILTIRQDGSVGGRLGA